MSNSPVTVLQKSFLINDNNYEIKIDNMLSITITKNNLNITDIQISRFEYINIMDNLNSIIIDYSNYNSDYNETSIQGILTNKNIIHPRNLAINAESCSIVSIHDIETIYKLIQFEMEDIYVNKIIACSPKYDNILPMISIMKPYKYSNINANVKCHKRNKKILQNLLIIPEKYSDIWIKKINNYYKYDYLIINNESILGNNYVKNDIKMNKLYNKELLIIIVGDDYLYYSTNSNVNSFCNLINKKQIEFYRIFYYYCEINSRLNNYCIKSYNFISKFKYYRIFNFELHKTNFLDFYSKHGKSLSTLEFIINNSLEKTNTTTITPINNNLQMEQLTVPINIEKIILKPKHNNQDTQMNYIHRFIKQDLESSNYTGSNIKNYFSKLFITDNIHNPIDNIYFNNIITKGPQYLTSISDILDPKLISLLKNGQLEEYINKSNINYDTTKNIVSNIIKDLHSKQFKDIEVEHKIDCIKDRLSKENECVICLAKLSTPAILKCCNNKCCLECILLSYKSSSSCPFCRNKTHYKDNIIVLNDTKIIPDKELEIDNEENESKEQDINVLKIIDKCKKKEKNSSICYIIKKIHKHTPHSKIIILSEKNYKICDKNKHYSNPNDNPNKTYEWDVIMTDLAKNNIRVNINKDDKFKNDNHSVLLISKKYQSNRYLSINYYNTDYNTIYYNNTYHFDYNFKTFDLQGCTDIIIPQKESPQSISNIKLFAESIHKEIPIRIWEVVCDIEK